MYVCPCIIV